MKVRVSYNTDLEDVPDIVDGILAKCRSNLESNIAKIKIDHSGHQKTVQNLVEIRDVMTLVDEQIQDCINLYSGWHNAVSPDVKHEVTPPEPVPDTRKMPAVDEEDFEQQI